MRGGLDNTLPSLPRPRIGSQIETEAVDMHLGYPIAQAVQDVVTNYRMVAIQGVAAPGIIQIPLVRIEQVVRLAIQAAPASRGLAPVSLASVIEDNVQHHFEAGSMELANHLFEFRDRGNAFARGGVRRLGREKRQGVITPEIHQPASGDRV